MKTKTHAFKTLQTSRGFTLVELLVVITIIIVLAGISFSVVGKMRASADRTRCMSRLHSWGIAIGSYAADNNGKVTANNWASIGTDDPSPYLIYWTSSSEVDSGARNAQLEMRHCPSVKHSGTGNPAPTYAFIRPNPLVANSKEYPLAGIQDPSHFMFMVETVGNTGATLSSESDFTSSVKPISVNGPDLRHNHAVNTLLGDFSVKSMTYPDIQKGLKLGYWVNLQPLSSGGR